MGKLIRSFHCERSQHRAGLKLSPNAKLLELLFLYFLSECRKQNPTKVFYN